MNMDIEPTDYAAQLVRFTDGNRQNAAKLFELTLKDNGRYTVMPSAWNEAVLDAIGRSGTAALS